MSYSHADSADLSALMHYMLISEYKNLRNQRDLRENFHAEYFFHADYADYADLKCIHALHNSIRIEICEITLWIWTVMFSAFTLCPCSRKCLSL